MATAFDAIRDAAGAADLREATAADAVLGVRPQAVLVPHDAAALARALAAADAAGLAVLPRGGGTKRGWGGAPRRADLVLSLERLSRVIEHAASDLTVTVEAGVTLAALDDVLAAHAQRLALDGLWPTHATIGGALATNDAGPLRHRFGGPREQLIGATLALPDGTLAKSGGKVVKNVAGYDLGKLAVGSFGTLGVIVEATFRLYPRARTTLSLSIDGSLDELERLALAIAHSTLTPSGLQLRASDSTAPRLDVRLEGVAAGVEAQRHVLLDLAHGAPVEEAGDGAWNARTSLWTAPEPRAVARLAVLPAAIARVTGAIGDAAASAGLGWDVVLQGAGTGHVALWGDDPARIVAALERARAIALAAEGSLVLLDGPSAVRGAFDAWGDPGDAFPLMKRLRDVFDAKGTLNPGRFVGGL